MPSNHEPPAGTKVLETPLGVLWVVQTDNPDCDRCAVYMDKHREQPTEAAANYLCAKTPCMGRVVIRPEEYEQFIAEEVIERIK
jgi:hypothetical protein